MPNFNRAYTKATKQTYNGRSYRSRKEAEYAMYLDAQLKAKQIKDWKYEQKIELCGEYGSRVCNYYVDFTITHNDNKTEYIEIKGMQSDIWRLKKKLMEDKVRGMGHMYKYTVEYV